MSKSIKEQLNNEINNQMPSIDLWNKIESSLPKQMGEEEAREELDKLAQNKQQHTRNRVLPYAGVLAAACVCFVFIYASSQFNIKNHDSASEMMQDNTQSDEAASINESAAAEEESADMMEEAVAEESADMVEEAVAEDTAAGEVEEGAEYEESLSPQKQMSNEDNIKDEVSNGETRDIIYEKIQIKIVDIMTENDLPHYLVQIMESNPDSPFKKDEQIKLVTDTYSGNALILNADYLVDLSLTEDKETYRLVLIHK